MGRGTIAGHEFHVQAKDSQTSSLDRLVSLEALKVAYEEEMETPQTVVYLSLNQFSVIRDQYSYSKAQYVLTQTVEAIYRNFGQMPVARVDLSNFAFFTNLSEPLTASLVQKIQEEVSELLPGIGITLWAGLCPIDEDSNFYDLLDNAKFAVKNAKGDNRGQYLVVFDEEMRQDQAKEHFVRDHIDEAVKKGYIRPYYQPLVGSLSQNVIGFEALARWIDPKRGFIMPDDFVPYLERLNEAYKLDLHILEAVCQDLSQHPELTKNNLFVNVNLSRLDFMVRDIPREISRILGKYDLPKDAIQFEITESAIGNDQIIKTAVDQMNQQGYKVWIDDFGTGQSSLYALKDLNVHGVKIDQSFFASFPENKKVRPIIRSIVELCQQTGALMIAEGIEDTAKVLYARQWGVNFLQGFYYSKPISLEDLLASPFMDELTVESDVPVYRPAARVNLYTALEAHYYQNKLLMPVFAKGVLERSGEQITFLRVNQDLLATLRPYLQNKDFGFDPTGELREKISSQLLVADRREDVYQFRLGLGSKAYYTQLVPLTKEGDKATYILSMTDVGLIKMDQVKVK
ncbi:EAL domain-containing protein [Lactobacillus sp.]|uniref:EAL domain-containing protein n=1 Tax=Lactobacillus sp. TaxID=1591 RepID=UPI003EF11534